MLPKWLCGGQRNYLVSNWNCAGIFGAMTSFDGQLNVFEIVERHITFHCIVESPATSFTMGGSTMFDRLFHKARVRARHENGPLAEERRRFLTHCAEQQMSAGTLQNIASYTLLVANVLRLADRSGELITKDEVKAEAERRAHRQPKPQRKRPLSCAGGISEDMLFDG